MNQELLRVLEAREARWQRRLALAQGTGCTLVTVTLCLPVAYRADPALEGTLLRLCRRFRAMLRAAGLHYREEGMLRGADGPAVLLTVGAPAEKVKALCVRAERLLPGGRMLDIDVMNGDGEPVGRSALGLPPRRCFVCGEAAAVCVSRKLHSREEIDCRVRQLLAEAAAGLGRQPRQGSAGFSGPVVL